MIEILNFYINSKSLFKMMFCDTAVSRAEYAIPPAQAEVIPVNGLDEAIIYKDMSFRGNLYVCP